MNAPPEKIEEDLLQQVIDRFWESIPPVWAHIRDNVRQTAEDAFGISVEQFQVLRLIRKGVRSVSELADSRRISRPAISQSVDVLVEKGLISRHTSQTDRRFIGLELTPTGSTMLEAIFEKNHEWMRSQLAELTPEELQDVLRGIKVLRKTFID